MELALMTTCMGIKILISKIFYLTRRLQSSLDYVL